MSSWEKVEKIERRTVFNPYNRWDDQNEEIVEEHRTEYRPAEAGAPERPDGDSHGCKGN